MERVELEDRDMRVAREDIERKGREVASECVKVWDSMEGKLPSFESFCKMYMGGRWKRWCEKARWN